MLIYLIQEKQKREKLNKAIMEMLQDCTFNFKKGIKKGHVQDYLAAVLLEPVSNDFRERVSVVLLNYRIIEVRRSNFNYYKQIDYVRKYKSIVERYNQLLNDGKK